MKFCRERLRERLVGFFCRRGWVSFATCCDKREKEFFFFNLIRASVATVEPYI
jgi:hypothetical protein